MDPEVSPYASPSLTAQLCVKVAVNLDEDGINLWLAALRNSTNFQSDPNLLGLFPHAMTLLESNLDLLGKVTSIVESYFFVDAFLVLQVCKWNTLVSPSPTTPSDLFVGPHECSHECHAWPSPPDKSERRSKLRELYDPTGSLIAVGRISTHIRLLQSHCKNSQRR